MRRGSRGGFGATAAPRMLRNNVGRMDAASKGFGAGRLDCGEADGQRRGPRVERLSSSAVPE